TMKRRDMSLSIEQKAARHRKFRERVVLQVPGPIRARHAQKMIRQLAVKGWGVKDIAKRAGWNPYTVNYLRTHGREFLAPKLYREISLVYDDLIDRENESEG